MLARALALLVLAIAFCLAAAPIAHAQDGGDGDPVEPAPAPKAEAEQGEAPLLLDESVLARAFRASSVSVEDDGRVKLHYDFSTKDANLLEDWFPEIAGTKRRIRWSQGYEGTWTTVEDGLIIADHGTFVHKAVWDGDVELSLDYLSMSGHDKSDLLAVIYLWDKGKKIVGSQVGEQCIRLSRSLAPKGRPIPARALAQLSTETRLNFGMRLRDGIVSALRGGRALATSAEDEEFVDDPEPGQVGLAWRGRVNGFIFDLTIEGRLDPDWVREHAPNAIRKSAPEEPADAEEAGSDR